mmetsp:Transcript_30921/g.103009  ORF Transcript_30921/g.103009 Transcript_30921/m.103009 type:complete len:462 (-) Transcript_30921:7677-9062(-)
MLDHARGGRGRICMDDQELLLGSRGAGGRNVLVELLHTLIDVRARRELVERDLVLGPVGVPALQLVANLAEDRAVGQHHDLGAKVVAPSGLVLDKLLSKGGQVGVHLLLEILRDHVEAKLRDPLLLGVSAGDHAHSLRGQHQGQHALRLLQQLLHRELVLVTPPQHEHQGGQKLRVVARNGPRPALGGLGGGIRVLHGSAHGLPELDQPVQKGLVLLHHEVLSQEDLLLEAIQQRWRQPVVRVGDLGHHDDAEESMHRALLHGLRAVCDADVPLAAEIHEVLVEQVVQRLVERVAVDEHQRDRLLHEGLDPLQVHGDEDVVLVVREGTAEHHFRLVVVDQPALEEQPQGGVVLRQQHEVPSIGLVEVLLDELHWGIPRRGVHIHADALEEDLDATVQLLVGAAAEVALHSLHEHLGLEGGTMAGVGLRLELGVDDAHGGVELAHAPEVHALLRLVGGEESF